MNPEPEKTEGNFIVSQWKTVDFIIGGILLIIAIAVIYNISHKYDEDHTKNYEKLLALTLIPGISFIIKGFKNTVVIKINSLGIYQYNTLVTTWQNFVSAQFQEEPVTGRFQDNFVLNIYYFNPEKKAHFLRKIKMSSTFNKSGEEVIAAIKQYNPYLKNSGLDAAISGSGNKSDS